jgi:molybdopterin/thiamine biosynthesis adenylyltransferase
VSRFEEIDCQIPNGEFAFAPAKARLPNFIGFQGDAAASLREWKLAIVAAGSVGRRIALSAARLHPHTLWIVDPSRYKAESLLTQEIMPADVGQSKATSTAQACKAISPATRVYAFAGSVQQLPLDALADAHACALSTDNLKAEVETGQRMLRLGIPLAHAGVHGDSLVAQVRLYANRDGQGPCPACGFTQVEWDHLNRETQFRCGGQGEAEEQTFAAPTMSTAFLCSLAADLTLVQLVRHRLGLGKPVGDTMMQYCGYTHAVNPSAPLLRNPNCPCEHVAWRRVESPRPLDACSLLELAEIAQLTSRDGLAFTVGELSFVEAAWCCGRPQPVGRFAAPGSDGAGASCPSCGKTLPRQPYFTHRSVPASALALDERLEKFGATGVSYVSVRNGDRAVLIRNPNS